jgi:ribosome-binding protein aMBF1 (putative translation factor)
MGQRIRAAREKRGMTRAQLAAAIGVATCSVCRWELGRRTPEAWAIRALEYALGLQIGSLLVHTRRSQ